jgi:hypothetical protein
MGRPEGGRMRDYPTPTAQTGWRWGALGRAAAEGEPEKERALVPGAAPA